MLLLALDITLFYRDVTVSLYLLCFSFGESIILPGMLQFYCIYCLSVLERAYFYQGYYSFPVYFCVLVLERALFYQGCYSERDIDLDQVDTPADWLDSGYAAVDPWSCGQACVDDDIRYMYAAISYSSNKVTF